MAQIAREVKRLRVKNPKTVKLEEFLMQFVNDLLDTKEEGAEVSQEQLAKRTKSLFMGALGLNPTTGKPLAKKFRTRRPPAAAKERK